MSATPATATLLPVSAQKVAADRLVLTSSLLALGAGAIPIPLCDLAAVAGVQVKMLSDISGVYGIPFSDNLGKSAVATLVGGLTPGLLARGSFGMFFKAMPGIGSIIGTVALPALAAGCTYAIGQVFIKHYESGGTLLTFNAQDFKASFTDEVKAGMKKVAAVKI